MMRYLRLPSKYNVKITANTIPMSKPPITHPFRHGSEQHQNLKRKESINKKRLGRNEINFEKRELD
jgi:hypothetical protein